MHKGEFMHVDEVVAAAGVKIVAQGLENVVAGAPLYVVPSEEQLDEYVRKVKEEVEAAKIKTEIDGVIVKADTLGTLEAIVGMLKNKGIPVRLADVGAISKRDVIEAAITLRSKKEYGVILGFNTKVLPEAAEEARKHSVKIFLNNVIYKLIEDYEEWLNKLREEEKRRELEKLVRPGKIRIIPGYVFRRSEPAIVGVEVLSGIIKPGYPVMREDGKRIGEIMQIQDKGKPIPMARVGQAVAISIRGRVMIGRHVDEGDVLYTDIPNSHVKILLTKYRNELSDDEILALKEIIKIKRKSDPTYAFIPGVKI